jgi:RIO-like serine/threonine protein kinase
LNVKVETSVLEAYSALHKLKVLHGDIRRENIIVLKDGSVRIFYFEYGDIVVENVDNLLMDEDTEVALMLQELKCGT